LKLLGKWNLNESVNRLSPLIVRRTGPLASAIQPDEAAHFAVAMPAAWLDDLRLFATGWVGGLIFFGTLLG
jgi:hypothetical protein